MSVTFHTEKTDFTLSQKLQHKRWIKEWIVSKNAVCGSLSFIFTSNKELRFMNRKYLNHTYFTDVITFDYTRDHIVSGDIFISVEQVRLNAKKYGAEEGEELRRVMIHGVIHLMGYDDGTDDERATMHQMENEALHLWLKMV